jgi:tetratricopeptide (TPR) repeat protein
MTTFRFLSPCPQVIEANAASFLDRARWLLSEMSVADWHARAQQDIEHAIALEPAAWQAWALRAETAVSVAPKLRFYGEAIRRGADLSVRLDRGRHLAWIGRFAEAEQDYSAILDVSPHDPWARADRVMVRAQLGNYAGAIADLAVPGVGCAEHHVRELLGIFRWIQGDFQAAYEAFTRPVSHADSEKRDRIWSHLCQIGHGVTTPLPPESGRSFPEEWLGGVACSGTDSFQPIVDEGPMQPRVCIWDLLTERFLDRIEPGDVLRMARGDLQKSDAWQPPIDLELAEVGQLLRHSSHIWRSEIQFYCGLWYLSKRRLSLAQQALRDAAQGDRSDSLERLAAAAQLARLDQYQGNSAVVAPLALPAQSPFSAVVAKFVGLDIKMPELSPTPLGAALNLARQDIGDVGLCRLLESRNTRFLTRLDLGFNGISTAGMAAFRESSYIVNLVELKLAGNPIGDIGLRTLLRSSALVSLKSLDLTDTGMTDAGAAMLAEQHHVGLERIFLGTASIDMPIWRRLAEKYGEGLFAVGAFHRPYEPPFDKTKLISFSHVPTREFKPGLLQSPDDDGLAEPPASTLMFKLVDYVAWRLERLARASSHGRGAGFIESALGAMREIEAQFANPSQSVHREEGAMGYDLIAAGLEPVSLDCAACRKSYDRPFIRGPGVGSFSLDGAFLCPAGHELHRQPWYS